MTTQLHTLIKSRTKFSVLARTLGITQTALHKWVRNNHVPISRVTDFANALDIEIRDVLEFASRPDNPETSERTINKPTGTLEMLLAVKQGKVTIEEASKTLGVSEHSLAITYQNNVDRLETLIEALHGISEERYTPTEAGRLLGVTRTQMWYLMRVYGVPKPPKKPKKDVGRYTAQKPELEKAALDVIAGRISAKQVSEKRDMSVRTLHRHIERLTAYKLNALSHWPKSFRRAYALELESGALKLVEKLLEYAKKHGLILKKNPPLPKPVADWRLEGRERILLAVLLGEETLDEIATLRRGSKQALEALCDGALHRFRLRLKDALALPLAHQAALADLMLMEGSYFRREKA